MARVFIVLVAVFAVLALAEAGKVKNQAKVCSKNIMKFEACLDKGYKSKAGCESGDGELNKKDMKKCLKLEKKVKKCEYECKMPEPGKGGLNAA